MSMQIPECRSSTTMLCEEGNMRKLLRKIWDWYRWNTDSDPQVRVVYYPGQAVWQIEERWNGFGLWIPTFGTGVLHSYEQAVIRAEERHHAMLNACKKQATNVVWTSRGIRW